MDNLFSVINEWNFWKKVPYTGISRGEYLVRLRNLARIPEIGILIGVRRCGKSTLLLQLIRELHEKDRVAYANTLYINFEDPRLGENLKASDLFVIYDTYRKNLKPKGRIYLFLDEVQKVKEWQRFARTLYDQGRKVKIFLTGSSSRLTNSQTSGLLSGRAVTLKVYPLNFSEFRDFNGKGDFEEYLRFGGFPRVVLEKEEINKKALLVSYYETILERDVILANNIKNKLELKALARYALSNCSAKISSYNLEKVLAISNVNINRYLNFLEEAFIISRVPRFSYSVKKQIYNPDKLYCVDCGLVNTVGFNFSENRGRLLENLVFQKLQRGAGQIFYWQGKSEIDFLLFAENRVQKLINVTTTVDDPQVLERELISLQEGGDEFTTAKQTLLCLYNESKQSDPRIESLPEFLCE